MKPSMLAPSTMESVRSRLTSAPSGTSEYLPMTPTAHSRTGRLDGRRGVLQHADRHFDEPNLSVAVGARVGEPARDPCSEDWDKNDRNPEPAVEP